MFPRLSRRHRRRQMHQQRHPGNNPVGVRHQPDQLPQRRLSPQIDDSTQFRMPVSRRADLHKLNSVRKVIHHLLVALHAPPLDRVIPFPARRNDPDGFVGVPNLVLERLVSRVEYRHFPAGFLFAQMNIAPEVRRPDIQVQLLIKILNEGMKKVPRLLVAAM